MKLDPQCEAALNLAKAAVPEGGVLDLHLLMAALCAAKGMAEGVRMPAWFYILRLRSGALYPGATTNLKRSYEEHRDGHACRTTKFDPPCALVYSEETPTVGAQGELAGVTKIRLEVAKGRRTPGPCELSETTLRRRHGKTLVIALG